MKFSIISLCVLLSAIPASIALPDPSAFQHGARQVPTDGPIACPKTIAVNGTQGRDCPAITCTVQVTKFNPQKFPLQCATITTNVSVDDGRNTWVRVRDGHPMTLNSAGVPIPGGIWFPISTLDIEFNNRTLPTCNYVEGSSRRNMNLGVEVRKLG